MKQKKIVDEALEELKEGASAIAERQKHIRIADQSEYHWRTVEAYKSGGIADNEKDAKKLKQAEKSAEQEALKEKQKAATAAALAKARRPPPPPPMPPLWPTAIPPRYQLGPAPIGGPPPIPSRPVGPCFNCGQLGHLKLHCPKLARQQYPLHISSTGTVYVDNVKSLNTVAFSGDVGNNNVTVTDTACYGGYSNISECIANVDIVRMSEGGVANNNIFTNVTCRLTGDNNINAVTDIVDALCPSTHPCPTISVDELPSAKLCTKSPSSCEMLGVDRDKDLQRELAQSSLNVDAIKSVRGLGTPEPLGSVCEDALPDILWEVEQGEGQVVDLQGRLKRCLSFWENELDPAPWITSCIREGYKLPLRNLPEKFSMPNQQSALDHNEFVSQALEELEQNQCIIKTQDPPHVCSPLSVVSNRQGKLRLVLNLRYLNQFLWVDKFKYEDLRTAMLMFQRDDYLFSFDLKSGYHHVDIFEPHWQFLGFKWEVQGVTQFYLFTVLPFGLATACYVFTKLLRPLVKYWRSQGLHALLYLDDGIVAVAGKEAAGRASRKVREDLVRAGLVENSAKCSWEPSQQAKWLGFELDLEQGQISIPEEKIEALKAHLGQAADQPTLKARDLASITGKIISMSLALGPVSRLMTRSMYALLNTKEHRRQSLTITPEVKEELQFWINQVDHINGKEIWHSPSAVRVVYSDASATGYGGFTVEHGCHVAHGAWSEVEMTQSSTWRELKAVRMVLESLLPKLKNERVRWFSDNQNVVWILETGSKKPLLQKEAISVFSIAAQSLIRIEPKWIPRTENQQANYLSRIQDRDDWIIQPALFATIDQLWGPHTIDRFANNLDTQLPRFNSRFWCPGTEAVDTFTCDCRHEVNWACSPPHLISRTIRHAAKTCSRGTLIVPAWPSAPFWPVLYLNGCEEASFIKETMRLPKSHPTILPGRSGGILPSCDVLAIRFEFPAS